MAVDHPAGRAKAAFFGRFGFHPIDWQELSEALLVHARPGTARMVGETAFGKKYIVEGVLSAPDGRQPRVRAIWFVPSGENVPRLVTAYALPGGG